MVDINRINNTWGNGPYANGGYTSRSPEKTLADLSAQEFLDVLRIDLLPKLRDELEDAKLRYEDEDDETTLGEYMGMKATIEALEQFLNDAPKRYYNTMPQQSFGKMDPNALYQYYSNQRLPATQLWNGKLNT